MMAMNAAHCHIISGDLEAAAAMMEEVAAYRALNKTNWVPQDRVAFRVLGEFEARHIINFIPCHVNPNINGFAHAT